MIIPRASLISHIARTLTFLFLVGPGAAVAGDAMPAKSSFGYGLQYTNTENAEFNHSIPIEVPAYLGAEPSLALHYSSAGGNGILGMGWSLSGLRTIERHSPGKGTPRYDATDVYYLDGQELLPCTTANASVSCTYGGTHFAKVENYERITFIAATNEWRIHQKGGNTIFLKTLANPGRTWVTFTEVGRNGAQTDYTWGNISTTIGHPLLVSIGYGPAGGHRVLFAYDNRPDPVLSAIGASSLLSLGSRLTQIIVQSHGAIRHGYKLTYRNDLEYTGVSLLTSVQKYGSNLTVDANFRINGGSALPATTIGWQGDSVGLQGAGNGPGYPAVSVGAAGLSTLGSQRWLADIDGDGRMDLVRKDSGNTLTWSTSNGGGWDALRSQSSGIHGNGVLRWMADVNGDGRADYVTKTGDSNIHYNLSQGRFSFAAGVTQNIGMGIGNTGATWMIDLNGDGYSDYVTHVIVGGVTPCFNFALGGSTGFGPRRDSCTGIHGLGAYRWWADINGDGALDYNAKNNDGNHYWNIYDRKTNTFLPGQSQSGMHTQGNFLRTMADINGDGKSDYVVKNTDSCIYWNLSLGNGFGPGQSQCGLVAGGGSADFADINGDGKADYVQMQQGATAGANTNYVWHLSNGNNFVAARSNYLAYSYMPAATTTALVGLQFGDVEGDGKNDVIAVHADAVYRPIKAVSGSRLISSIANGYGKTITVAYLNSNQNGYSHINNPPSMQTVDRISVNDGRGNIATTTYRFANGYYDRAERQFRGFGYANISLPCIVNHAIVSASVTPAAETDCPIVKNWYHQNSAMHNELSVSERYSGSRLLERTEYKYWFRTDSLPYRANLTSLWNLRYFTATACDSATACEWTTTDFYYDFFANVIGKIEHGDIFLTGDERFTESAFLYTTSPILLVDRKGAERVYKGTSSATPKLSETLFCYDQSGNTAPNCALNPVRGDPTTVKRWLKDENRHLSSHTAYNGNGTVSWTKDGVGNQTSYIYETFDPSLVRSTTNAKLQTWNTTWNPVCQAQSTQVDYNNIVVESIQYDPFCRIKRKDMPQGNYAAYHYCQTGDANNDCSNINPNGNGQHVRVEFPNPDGSNTPSYVKTYLDGFGREIGEHRLASTAFNSIVTNEKIYNARGQITVLRMQGGLSETRLNYDQLDRNTAIIHAGLSKTPLKSIDMGYTAPWRTTLVSPTGETTHIFADAYGRTSKEQKTYSTTETHETRYIYDTLGNRLEMHDAENNRWVDTYDSLGRKLTSLDPDRGFYRYSYFDNDKLRYVIDAKGMLTCYDYDPLLRLQKRTRNCNGSMKQTSEWIYDMPRAGFYNVGRLTSDTDSQSGARTDYNYDNGGRLTGETRIINGVSYAFLYGYDANGRRKWTTFPDGDTLGTPMVPLQYDSAGRVISIPNYVYRVNYGVGDKVNYFENNNGTITSYSYDAALKQTGIVTRKNLIDLQNLGYVRRSDGRIERITSPYAGEGWVYGYDTVGRLTSATNTAMPSESQTFAYSPSGNLTYNSRIGTYAYPTPGANAVRPHAVMSAGAQFFNYDANGSQSTRGLATLSWDDLNRLAAVFSNDVAKGTVSFMYDANDDRIMKFHTLRGVVTTTVYVKPNYQIKGGVVSKHIQFNGETIARKVGSVVNWIHNDHLGSVNVITDAAGSEVVRYRHRPFGERFGASNTTQEETDFLGERLDAESGLIYQRSRYYDPVLGRYTSADRMNPQISSVGPNRYAYAGNDPINHFDDGNQRFGAGSKGKGSGNAFGDAALDGAKDAAKSKIQEKISEFITDTAEFMTDAYVMSLQAVYGRLTGKLTDEGYESFKNDAQEMERQYLEKYSIDHLNQSVDRIFVPFWVYNAGLSREDWRNYVDSFTPSGWAADRTRTSNEQSTRDSLRANGIEPGYSDVGHGGVYFGQHGVRPSGGSSSGSSGFSSTDTSGSWGPYTGWTNTSGMTYDSGSTSTPSDGGGDGSDD